jgi:ATP-dependent Clp protease ATP-binding subunit ClpA
MSLFDSFSQRARRVIFRANSRALQQGAHEIAAEHILYGVLQEDPQLFALLADNNPRLASEIEVNLISDVEVSKPAVRTGDMQLSELAKEIIRVAAREKGRLGHRAVATQHLLLAILMCPEKRKALLRRAKPHQISLATQVLIKHGITAEAVEAATQAGIATSQAVVLDDPLLMLNAQLAALAELLITKRVLARHEFVALLDQSDEPLTPEVFLTPLIDALVKKGALTEDEKAKLSAKQASSNPENKTSV